jgi:putative phosphoserine phosphatase/1-acylglycerol-3-phosphate O-acyltransferase
MPQAAIAALFDFDGTLYTGHIWQDLTRHLWRARRHRRWVAAYVVRNMAPMPLYRLGAMSQETFYRRWGESMAWLVHGWTLDEAQDLFVQLTEEHILPNLRADILDRLHNHREQNHLVALVSGTFAPWLQIIAQYINADHAIGTPLVVRDGRYTGRIIPPLCQSQGKPQRVKAYLAGRELAVDWSSSFAYADSQLDLALFGQVGHPVAVYPDEILLAKARASGWPIVGEAR